MKDLFMVQMCFGDNLLSHRFFLGLGKVGRRSRPFPQVQTIFPSFFSPAIKTYKYLKLIASCLCDISFEFTLHAAKVCHFSQCICFVCVCVCVCACVCVCVCVVTGGYKTLHSNLVFVSQTYSLCFANIHFTEHFL